MAIPYNIILAGEVPVIAIAPFVMIVLIVALAVSARLIGAYMRHKEVMAAIEKGTPLSELMIVKAQSLISPWIKSITVGITLTIIGLALACVTWFSFGGFAVDGRLTTDKATLLFIAVIIFAFGMGLLMRGLLQRKAEKNQNRAQSSNPINNDVKKL